MPDHAPEFASAFRPLRRALIARRLQRLDPVLRLELALIGALAGGCAAWRARLPLDQLARTGGAGAAVEVLAASLAASALLGGLLAGANHAGPLRRTPPGPEWLALPVPAEAVVAAIRGLAPAGARERSGRLLAQLDLAGRAEELVAGLSHRMRKKLSFAAAVLHRPPVLLLVEALEGFDPAAALAAKAEVRELAGNGCTVVFASHAVESVERDHRASRGGARDRAVFLHLGRVARTLTRAEWGEPESGPSPLERAFPSATQGRHAPEDPA